MVPALLPLFSLLITSGCKHSLSSNLTQNDALLVVDMQNDFMEAIPLDAMLAPQYVVPDDQIILSAGRKYVRPGALGIEDSAKIVDSINTLMDEFVSHGAHVFLTLDWHPQNHCSFCRNGTMYSNTSTVNHKCGPLGPGFPPNFDSTGRCQDVTSLHDFSHDELMQWSDHCLQNEFGSRFTPYLRVPRQATVVKKGFMQKLDSYSAFSGTLSRSPYPFWDNDTTTPAQQVQQPMLGNMMAQRDIRRVFVVGLATDFGVRMSALDAAALRFDEVIVVTSATRGITDKGVEHAVKEMKRAEVKVLSKDAKDTKNILSESCDYDVDRESDVNNVDHRSAITALSVLLGLFACATVVLIVQRLRTRRASTDYVIAR